MCDIPQPLSFCDLWPAVTLAGGHPSWNMTHLPADMWRHEGFRGCVFDLRVAPAPAGPWMALRIAGSANVKECGEDECRHDSCSNGGTCVGLGATIRYVSPSHCTVLYTICCFPLYSTVHNVPLPAVQQALRCRVFNQTPWSWNTPHIYTHAYSLTLTRPLRIVVLGHPAVQRNGILYTNLDGYLAGQVTQFVIWKIRFGQSCPAVGKPAVIGGISSKLDLCQHVILFPLLYECLYHNRNIWLIPNDMLALVELLGVNIVSKFICYLQLHYFNSCWLNFSSF